MTTHDLRGLAADNLLAFLALLGVLRVLEAARPEWRPRASWSGPPWKPCLHLAAEATNADVAQSAAAGLGSLASAYEFAGRKNIDYRPDEFRTVAQATLGDRARADLIAALASDVSRRRDGRVQATALCAIFGQGHQNFLERLERLARDMGNERLPEMIARALFDPWTYDELELTFRWDPAEDRRYALGFADPSSEKIRTSAGANRLALAGFPMFVCAPTGTRLQTLGFRRHNSDLAVYWPIWDRPLSISAIRAMLAHPALVEQADRGEVLGLYGVKGVMRARRIQTGKYLSFEPARSL